MTVMTITAPNGHRFSYDVLQLFPFTSERKRMGIIVRVSLLKMNVIFFLQTKISGSHRVVVIILSRLCLLFSL